MHVTHRDTGWIEVICGPMFSGKSEELIRRLRRARIARQPLQAFKPRIDDRYHASHIVSHSQTEFEAVTAATASDVARAVSPETRVVGIDEAQFFDAGIVEVCERLADRGVRVIVAGLDQDYLGRPFEPMPALLAVAEYVTKALAICARCGGPAGRSQRLAAAGGRVAVGAADLYEARCRACFVPRVEPTTGELFDEPGDLVKAGGGDPTR
jgi:thymidine kinase